MKTNSRVFRIFLLSIAILCSSFQVTQAQLLIPSVKSVEEYEALFSKFSLALESQNDAQIMKISDQLIESPVFNFVDTKSKAELYSASAYAYLYDEQDKKVKRAARFLQNVRIPDNTEPGFRAIGFQLEFFLHQYGEDYLSAARSLIDALNYSHGPASNDLSATVKVEDRDIYLLFSKLKNQQVDPDYKVRAELYGKIFDYGYELNDIFGNLDSARLEYAEILLRSDEKQKALTYVRQIQEPTVLVSIYIDKTYEEFWPAIHLREPAQIKSIIEDTKRITQMAADQNPHLLKGQERLMRLNNILGYYDISISLGESAIKRMNSSSGFADSEDRMNWFLEVLARAYEGMGDKEKGFSYRRSASYENEVDGTNVSNVINYGSRLLAEGRYEEVLSHLDREYADSYASDFGEMFVWQQKSCSYYHLGNLEKSDFWAEKVKMAPSKNYGAYTENFLCRGEIESAAQAMRMRILKPTTRNQALKHVQSYKEVAFPTKTAKQSREKYDQMMRDPMLMETVNRYGRIIDWPVTHIR